MNQNHELQKNAKRFLIRHVGNMGDMVFLVPPALATLKKTYPGCHITLVTVWGFKDSRGRWGKRMQDGACIHLMMTNPNVDQLIHYHDTKLSLTGDFCQEEGQQFVTWNKAYYDEQKASGKYDGVFELDLGLAYDDNPLEQVYKVLGLPQETYSKYELYLTEHDRQVAELVMQSYPSPRIVLLEGLAGTTTRGWDPGKIPPLVAAIHTVYGVEPIWFGSQYIPEIDGRPLSLRENIATLTWCDVGIGVLSGPLHFAAAVGLPTITLYGDHPLRRAAPAYFFNRYIPNEKKQHRTLLGPTTLPYQLLKHQGPAPALTREEAAHQGTHGWQRPGKQATKSCVAVLTVDEIMAVLHDSLPTPFASGS